MVLTWGILEKGQQMGVAMHQPWSRISAAFCVQSAYITIAFAYINIVPVPYCKWWKLGGAGTKARWKVHVEHLMCTLYTTGLLEGSKCTFLLVENGIKWHSEWGEWIPDHLHCSSPFELLVTSQFSMHASRRRFCSAPWEQRRKEDAIG